MRTLYATSVPMLRRRRALIPRACDTPQLSTLPDRHAAATRAADSGRSTFPAMLLTARDLTARGYAPRTAQRLLARLARQGLAHTVATGGRPALAVDAATLARLGGADLETVTECP